MGGEGRGGIGMKGRDEGGEGKCAAWELHW
jgi:hypothetical protein